MNQWEERFRPTPTREPQLQLLELHWVLRGPSGRDLRCELFRVETGLELRVSYSAEDLIRSERVVDVGRGRARSREMLDRILEKDGDSFTVVQLPLHEG